MNMATPEEYINERSKHLSAELEKYSIESLENLNNEDFRLFGFYIQLYNYIDLNVKSIYLTLKDNGLIEQKKREHVPYMISVLAEKSALLCVQEGDDEEDVKLNLHEIGYRRSFRNVLAHWAAKRIPGEDAFVFFSTDKAEYKKIIGSDIKSGHVGNITLDAADLRGLALSIHKYERWIAIVQAKLYEKTYKNQT
jgi:hypothetical protein